MYQGRTNRTWKLTGSGTGKIIVILNSTSSFGSSVIKKLSVSLEKQRTLCEELPWEENNEITYNLTKSEV